jgi:hypothetical protein
MSTHATDPVALTIDDEIAAAAISRIRWRLASSGPWPEENTFTAPLARIVIERPALTDIEIEVTWRAGALRLRDPQLRARARSRGERPMLHGPAMREIRRRGAAADGGDRTTLYRLPGMESVVATLG